MAPSKKPINWQEVETAMLAGCNQEKIAGSQGVHVDTLRDNFLIEYGIDYSTYSNQMHRKGEVLLEVAQMKKAIDNSSKGNAQMLMYLGKVRLGQIESTPNQKSINDGKFNDFDAYAKDPQNQVNPDDFKQKTTDELPAS